MYIVVAVVHIFKHSTVERRERYLHPEEGDTGEEVHCGFQVLQPLGTAGRKVVLQSD